MGRRISSGYTTSMRYGVVLFAVLQLCIVAPIVLLVQQNCNFGSTVAVTPNIFPAPAINKTEHPGSCTRKIIYFLHIHKAAGSLVCQGARKANLITVKNANCNVWKRENVQYCCGDTLEEQRVFANTSKLEFLANEGYMPREMDFDCFEYMTVLREPVARSVSHYLFARDLYFGKHMSVFDDWLQRQPDNYITRVLCGEACRDLPRGKITREIFEKVLARLRSFRYVLVLEDINAMDPLDAPFQLSRHAVNRHTSVEVVTLSKHAQTQYDLFRWDWELYHYARYRLQSRHNTGEITYFKLNCSNPCCGNCSEYKR